jgi:hypothetical protein
MSIAGSLNGASERQLWTAVIVQALRDAVRIQRYGERPRNDLHAKQAWDWVVHGGRDFVEVCSLAGIDPGRVKDALLDGTAMRWLDGAGTSIMRRRSRQ